MQRGVAVGGDRVEFPAEHDVAGVAGPVEERDAVDIRSGSAANIARIGVMPTPPAMSSTRRPLSDGRERAVRSLGDDPGAGPQVGHRRRCGRRGP